MVDQNLLTWFVALTALAVLIQTGILVGFYVVSLKLSRQAEQAMEAAQNVLTPIQTAAETLQAVSSRVAGFNWWRKSA